MLNTTNNNSSADAGANVPNAFICPITQEVMQDPVIAEDGYSYERAAIMALVQGNKIRSPMTRQQMSNIVLPNRALKDTIEEYKRSLEVARQNVATTTSVTAPNASTNHVAQVQSLSTLSQPQPPVASVSEHDALIVKLMQGLDCEVHQVAETAAAVLVAVAGTYAKQDNALITRDTETGGTKCTLQFASVQDHQRFVQYYRSTYQGSITKQGSYDQAGKKATVLFSTRVFHETIAPALQEHKHNGFGTLITTLAQKLQVPISDVVSGDAVERRLVAFAGIYKPQKRAMYRWNADCTTRFHLEFASQQEYDMFINHYAENYPRFVVRGEGYKAGLSIVHTNTKVLVDAIAPQLQQSVEGPTPLPTHDELMAKLAADMRCTTAAVSTDFSQVLVAVAGIYTKQTGAQIARQTGTTHTNFTLCLATVQEHQQLFQYYTQKHAGCIIEAGNYNNAAKQAVITVDTKILHERIAPALVEHKGGWFGQMMTNLATGLNVPYSEIDYGGDALEKRLVRNAGITTSQKDAQYRGNADYSTRLHLAFAGNDEYQKFVDYYQQHQPQFILRDDGYHAPLSVIHVSTKVLMEVVVPTLRSLAI